MKKNTSLQKTIKILVVLSIVISVTAGCIGKNEQTVKTPSGDVNINTNGIGGWCNAGSSITSGANIQQGKWSFVIKGMTNYKGQRVCEADATVEQGGQSQSVTYYFSQDNKIAHMIIKDSTGTIVSDMDLSNPQTP